MKILCIGSTNKITDQQASDLAESNQLTNRGLLSDLDSPIDFESRTVLLGVYHTTFVDLSFERVQEAGKHFDKICVLDQSLNLWNTTTEFYETINYALQLEHNVEWQNTAAKENFLYWKDKIRTNKSLCVWPFVQMHLTDSHAKLCCNSDRPLDHTTNINDFKNKTYEIIRQKMISGEQLDHCRSCYRLEDNGIESARIQQTLEWVTRLNLSDTEDLTQITSPLAFEIVLDNLCNLQCRMCDPEASSLIAKEYRKIGIIRDTTITNMNATKKQHLDDVLKISNIQKIYLTGGEPSVNKRVHDFLNKCVQQNRTDILLQINTNAVKISERFIELVKNFDRIEFFVSVDAFGAANDYIRWRSRWNAINQNVEKLMDLGVVSFNVALSLYGIFSFHDLMTFLDQRYPGHYVHCQFAHNQSPFMIDYDQSQIEKIKDIRHLSMYNNMPFLRSWIDGLITQLEKSQLQSQNLRDFFVHNDLLDLSRNSKLSDYIPELEHQRKKI